MSLKKLMHPYDVARIEYELKCEAEFFDAVWSGEKTAELRKNDRNFMVGDTVNLLRTEDGKPTGEELRRRITYILRGGKYGLAQDYVMICLGTL